MGKHTRGFKKKDWPDVNSAIEKAIQEAINSNLIKEGDALDISVEEEFVVILRTLEKDDGVSDVG